MKKFIASMLLALVATAMLSGQGVLAASEPAAAPAGDITVQYGASWFLLVNDTIKGSAAAGRVSIPVSMRVIMLLTNVDPSSLEGEGEFSGQSYMNFMTEYGAGSYGVDISVSGNADYRGYSGVRLTLKNAGETLEGRMFADYTELFNVNLTVEDKAVNYSDSQSAPVTFVFKTQPASVGSVGRDVTIEVLGGYEFYFGTTTLKGKLYSNAEMDQQTYDEMMKQLEEFIDSELEAAEDQASKPSDAEQAQAEIDDLKDTADAIEILAEQYKYDPKVYNKMMLEAAMKREQAAVLEAQLAAAPGKK